MTQNVCFIGFGEAAQSFCSDERWRGKASGYDIKIDQPDTFAQKSEEFKTHKVRIGKDAKEASEGIDVVISLVTADQALNAAKDYAMDLDADALYLDMNSAAPPTKKAAADIMASNGISYVDVAIMAPVNPKQLDVPLLIAGEKAMEAETVLTRLGFQDIRIIGDKVGQASSIKMLRSVMIKGIEALTAECAIAADRAGVLEEVFGSMGPEWLDKVDYNFDRMMVHGRRRAAEMAEVVKTLESLGVEPAMSRGTVKRQHDLGVLGLKTPPAGLEQKLEIIHAMTKEAAE